MVHMLRRFAAKQWLRISKLYSSCSLLVTMEIPINCPGIALSQRVGLHHCSCMPLLKIKGHNQALKTAPMPMIW